MNTVRMLLTALILSALLGPSLAHSNDYPSPSGRYVSDFAGKISAQAEQALNRTLAAYDSATSIQIAIAIVDTLNGEQIASYAVNLAQTWKIGQNKKNNGVLILWAPHEHMSSIQVGYGLEGDLTDLESFYIRTKVMSPLLHAGYIDEAFQAAVDAIIARLGPTAFVQREEERRVAAQAAREKREQRLRTMRPIFIGVAVFSLISGIMLVMYLNWRRRKDAYLSNGKEIARLEADWPDISAAYEEATRRLITFSAQHTCELKRFWSTAPLTKEIFDHIPGSIHGVKTLHELGPTAAVMNEERIRDLSENVLAIKRFPAQVETAIDQVEHPEKYRAPTVHHPRAVRAQAESPAALVESDWGHTRRDDPPDISYGGGSDNVTFGGGDFGGGGNSGQD